MTNTQNGNVFIYILIAVVLFGALAFAISKSASQEDPESDLSNGQIKISTNEIISFSSAVSSSLTQMQQSGAMIDQIDFILPSDANFNDDPTIYKIFHPDGGGVNYRALPKKAAADDGAGLAAGYYVGRFNNIEWTPSTGNDVIFTAYEISEDVCGAINYKLRQDTTIPSVTGDSLANFFVFDDLHTGANADFMIANCAACEDISALCVTDGAGKYAFYSILDAQ